MPEPTSVGRRAQHSCVRNPQHLQDDVELALGASTLPSELRAFYAEHTELAPCLLSTAELAERFVPHVYSCKPRHAERQVQRANALIRRTYGDRFREDRRWDRRVTLTVSRWIKKPGGNGRSDLSDLDRATSSRIGDLDQQANADRARPRGAAFRSTPRSQREHERAREVGGFERRRAVPHGVRNPVLLEVAPVSLEGLAALRKRHSVAFPELVDELRRQRCHDHPTEACRAVRTLAERDTPTPLKLFRHLFKCAIDGDLLIDLDGVIEVDDDAELAARTAYAWDPDDPATHWPDVDDGSPRAPPEPTPDELEGRRWAAVRRAREVELRKPAGVGWWQILASITATGRFLASLKPETALGVQPIT